MRTMVTGGGGFLGKRIVELLRDRGEDVCFLARGKYPAVETLGATGIQVDIRDSSAVRAAIKDIDIIFHVAGKTGYWGSKEEFRAINVEGTRNVLDASRDSGVRCFIYTSTPSVVGYAQDVEGGDSRLPYAAVYESAYAQSKGEAEEMVLAANGSGIATIALRPHLIIGPGDRNLLPPVIRRAARGKLRIIGEGLNKVDLTYIDNAAWAHLDAADALTARGASCAGKSYFISNGQPVCLWEWLNGLLGALQLPPVSRPLSLRTTRLVGTMAELVWKAFRLRSDPPITRFLASALARSHWYNIEPAKSDLGYRVRVPMEEANRKTAEWLKATVLSASQPAKVQ